jgi:CrcB protein
MQALLFVGAGGALGSIARYLAGGWALRALGPGWPYGTLAVNVLGGALIGLLAGVLAYRGGADQERWRLLLQVGFLGGFTTFSAFSLETGLMLERREYASAALYVTASVALSVVALVGGRLAARWAFA